jgi:hypothetical protein
MQYASVAAKYSMPRLHRRSLCMESALILKKSYLFSARGVFRVDESAWNSLFLSVCDAGWSAPSSTEYGWMESPLIPYEPGSFFPRRDAAAFAETLAALKARTPGLDTLVEIFASGPVFIHPNAPAMDEDSAQQEIVYAYMCPQCGFIHHGRWFLDASLSRDRIEEFIALAMKNLYCPLCSSRDLLAEALRIPEIGGGNIPELSLGVGSEP